MLKKIAIRRFAQSDEKLFDFLITILVIIILILFLYPLILVASASFSDPVKVIEGKVWLFPKDLTLDPYRMVFENKSIWNGYKNTILYAFFGTLTNVILTIIAAYPLSRRDLPGRNFFMFLITFTMFFNGGLIPTYL